MKQYLSLIKLAALFVFVPLLIYLSAVSRTVRLYREYRQARELSDRGLSSTGTAATEIPDYAPVISNGDIVGLLSPICSRNGISIREYIPEEIERERDIWLCYAGIVLSGDFSALLETLSFIDKSCPGIRITDCSFKTGTKGRTGKTVLMSVNIISLENHL